MTTWTREQFERWDMETRYLVDRALDCDGAKVVEDEAVRHELFAKKMGCDVYHMAEARWNAESHLQSLELNREAYNAWARPVQPLTIDDIKRAIGMFHRDCPLHGCEGVIIQSRVPVHGPDPTLQFVAYPRWEVPMGEIYGLAPRTRAVAGQAMEDLLVFGSAQLRETPEGLVNVDPREAFTTRFELRVPFVAPDPRHVVRIRNIDTGDQASIAFADWNGPKHVHRSRVPPHVNQARPRLDGRRRR